MQMINHGADLWELMSKQYAGIDEADPVTVAAIFIDTGYTSSTQ